MHTSTIRDKIEKVELIGSKKLPEKFMMKSNLVNSSRNDLKSLIFIHVFGDSDVS